MALKHDAQGFLSGDAIDIGRTLSMWGDIRNDVRAIRQAVVGKSTTGAAHEKSDRQDRTSQMIATPVGRDSRGRFVKQAVAIKNTAGPAAGKAASANESVARLTARTSMPVKRDDKKTQGAVIPGGRDGRGRFLSNTGEVPNHTGKSSDEGVIRGFFDRLSGAVNSTTNSLEDADPAVKAVQEVAQPLARGYQMMTGNRSEKRNEGWFRKIYASLAGSRKEETISNKAINKTLKEIEDKPVGGDGGKSGLFGMLTGLLPMLARIPIIGPLLVSLIALIGGFVTKIMKLASKIPGMGGLAKSGLSTTVKGAAGAGAASGAQAAAKPGLLKSASNVTGKFAKKIPLIGSLIGLGMGAMESSSIEADSQTTRQEKNEKQGRNWGGVAGGLGGAAAGAAIGTLILPGVGTVIGGVIGAVAGDWLGGNAGEIIGRNFEGITRSISAGWTATTSFISAGWSGLVAGFNVVSEAIGINWVAVGESFTAVSAFIGVGWDKAVAAFMAVSEVIGKAWGDFVALAKSGWDGFTGLFSAAYEGLKKIPIIGTAIQAAEDAAKATAAAAKEVADKAMSAAKEAAIKAVVVAKDAATAAKTAYDSKTNPSDSTSPTSPASTGMVNKAAGAVGSAAGSVSNAAERAYNVTASAAGSTLEKVMPKGYRHKALFDGIKGGESLTKNGSYTDEEAAKIRELKTSGANTSANVIGGMSVEVQDKISAQAKKAGLDPVMMQKMAAMESGGNANAISSTGATGIYQFTGQTASGVGIKDRFDVDQNIEGGMKLANENSNSLKKSGLPVSAENLYMMHQLGPKAAQEVIRGAGEGKLKSDMSPATQKAMNLNYGSKSKTAADYIGTNKKALDDRYSSVTKETGGASAAIAKANAPTGVAAPIQTTSVTAKAAVAVPSAKESPSAPAPTTETKVASLRDDPTQGGRLSYKDIGDNQFQVTDSVTGVTELASNEQANAQRRSQTKAYRDSLAAANDPNSYKPGGVHSGGSKEVVTATAPAITSLSAPPEKINQVQTASVAAPKLPYFSPPPTISDAPPVISPLAASDNKKPVMVALAAQDVGQDLKDRRIAHIVTGGFSG